MNSFAKELPVGTRVTWTREVYRMPYSKRPIDEGEVVAHDDGGNFITARRDDGQIVTGPAVCFHKVQA